MLGAASQSKDLAIFIYLQITWTQKKYIMRFWYHLLYVSLSIKMKIGFFKKITKQTMQELGKAKWYHGAGLSVAIIRYESDWKCMGIYQKKTLWETDIHFKTVVCWNLMHLKVFTARIYYQFSGKYSSEMPVHYRSMVTGHY